MADNPVTAIVKKIPSPGTIAKELILDELKDLATEYGEDALRWAWSNTFGKKKKKPKALASGKGGGGVALLLFAAIAASRGTRRRRRR